MSLGQSLVPGQLQQMAAMEKSLLCCIRAASEDLQRVECFDEEQRAEVHAILEAIRHESESHSAMVQFLVARLGQESYHA